MATYKNGEKRPIIHLAAAAIAVDAVVVCGVVGAAKSSVGVAVEAIANTETGFVSTGGLWEFTKVSGAVIKAGESVNWDASAAAIDDNAATPATGDVVEFGKAYQDYGAGTTTMLVYIDEPGTYTA